MNVTRVLRTEKHNIDDRKKGSIVDRGANSGMAGSNVLILERHLHLKVDVSGVGDTMHEDLVLCTAAGKVKTMAAHEVILLVNQYADGTNIGLRRSIHSCVQMEDGKTFVGEKPRTEGGPQCMVTNTQEYIPIMIRDGLACVDMSPPTEQDLRDLEHIILTADVNWVPTCHDNEWLEEDFPAMIEKMEAGLDWGYRDPRVNAYGETDFSRIVDNCMLEAQEQHNNPLHNVNKHNFNRAETDWDALLPNFGWLPVKQIKDTFAQSTMNYRATASQDIRKHYKSCFPANNV
jgi:hypothetical protein